RHAGRLQRLRVVPRLQCLPGGLPEPEDQAARSRRSSLSTHDFAATVFSIPVAAVPGGTDATKARTIRPAGIEIIVSSQGENVIEFPCFRLKHAFEFQSVV